jgi:hypothetical protein
MIVKKVNEHFFSNANFSIPQEKYLSLFYIHSPIMLSQYIAFIVSYSFQNAKDRRYQTITEPLGKLGVQKYTGLRMMK